MALSKPFNSNSFSVASTKWGGSVVAAGNSVVVTLACVTAGVEVTG